MFGRVMRIRFTNRMPFNSLSTKRYLKLPIPKTFRKLEDFETRAIYVKIIKMPSDLFLKPIKSL